MLINYRRLRDKLIEHGGCYRFDLSGTGAVRVRAIHRGGPYEVITSQGFRKTRVRVYNSATKAAHDFAEQVEHPTKLP